MPLNLPPIPGKKVVPETVGEGGEELEFEDIPFKADYLYHEEDEVKAILKTGKKVLGTPAASLTWGIDKIAMSPAIEAGKEGEKQTAELLDKLAAEIPEMFVFHSLSWPESSGDTDHIVVYGNLILVIDSKRWKGSRKYTVTPKGQILRGTVPFPSGKVKIGYALHVWRKKLPKAKVYGVVTIAQEKVFVARDKNWYKAPYSLVENEKLEDYLRETFKKNPAKSVSGKMLVTLGLLLVRAKDRRSELIRVGGERRLPGE
jgi:hypothetical protein